LALTEGNGIAAATQEKTADDDAFLWALPIMPSAWTASEKKISNMETNVFMGLYFWVSCLKNHKEFHIFPTFIKTNRWIG